MKIKITKHLLSTILFISISFNFSFGQNTIGATLNSAESLDGYTLFTPNSAPVPNSTYLVNNCGEVINQWVSNFKGQGADLLMEDGSLYRACFDDLSTLIYPGNTGRIEKYDWDGNLLWGFTYSDTDYSFHHDYYPLANGNILMLVAERMSNAQAIQAGRDPSTLGQTDLYNEKIIEIQPQGVDSGVIVWEWSLWDHLIQDFDNTKDNFGVVGDNPGLLDINFIGFSSENADWTHLNSIDYNEDLDQILFSARFMSEFYIIDHSTTTQEAATGSGGNGGVGGNFMYRWGNSQAYNQGMPGDQKLFGQHSVHWIEDGLPDAGKIMIFNNGFMRGYTTVEILTPPLDIDNTYILMPNSAYGPTNSTIRYEDPVDQTNFFAPFLSSAYQLENGNVLINNGPIGQLIEVNQLNEIVWQYISPVELDGTILSQGDPPSLINTRFFRARRYAPDYPAFDGRDLTPSLPIEMNPNLGNCELLNIDEVAYSSHISIYPNPASHTLHVQTNNLEVRNFNIYNLHGKLVVTHGRLNLGTIDVNDLASGLYFIELFGNSTNQVFYKKFIKR